MITRFKQLYNKLTYSEAYDLKTGKFDSSKINTNKFTPHNLRALLVGYNGAVLVHYVSHEGRPIVEPFKFKGPIVGLDENIQQYNKWYEANFNEKKTLIDALWFSQGLKFNYVEEIYLFTDGFDEQEVMKEIQGLDAFLSNSNIRSSLKRLERIVKVAGSPITKELVQDLSEYYKTEKFNKNLVSFFKQYEGQNQENSSDNKSAEQQQKQQQKVEKKEFAFKGKLRFDALELNPERTELGLHIQPGLDSSKYALDCHYSPDLHKDGSTEGDKEKYRLSRYFYLEEQHQKNLIKAEAEKKAAEEAKKKAELDAKKKQEDYEALKKEVSRYAARDINTFVENVMGSLESLYRSGFNGVSQEGILVPKGDNSPIWSLSSKDNKYSFRPKEVDEGTSSDKDILDTLKSSYPQLSPYNYEGGVSVIPSFANLKSNSPSVLWQLHLLFQNPNMLVARGNDLYSIRKWITETTGYTDSEEWRKKVNGGSYSLKDWNTVQKWYRWVLNNLIVKALIENGVTGVVSDRNKVSETSRILASYLKNVIVVDSRQKLVEMEIRVSSGEALDSDNIVNVLKDALNNGVESGKEIVLVKERAVNNNNVKVIHIVFDEKKASKSRLFAGDLIDGFIDSGNVPSWSNALIGKKEDGTLFFWNGFMNPEKAGPADRCYTIYAGSRSGKGIMTSTLVASALADGRQVFYTDGKPENGAALGMIAWEKGKEAYVFDGQKEGLAPFAGDMEAYSNGVRDITEKYASLDDLKKIPGLFGDDFDVNAPLYLGVMRYLKSLMLCAEIIKGRASSKLPMDNWQIWIFDEMTSMSTNEREVREIFAEYCTSKGVGFKKGTGGKTCIKTISLKDIGDPDIINPKSMKFDKGIKFIYDWCQWTDSLGRELIHANTKNLGKANTNMIFIFQEPTWIPKDAETTSIANIVNLLQSTKIVGRNGIQAGCGDYGEANTKKTYWAKQVNIEGAGNWAMSHGVNIRSSDVTLFKPFNIFTVPNQSNALDRKVPDGVPATNYLAGYTEKLLGHFGMDTSEVLESAYSYADNAVRQLGLTKGTVKDYIYDCSFSLGNKNNISDVGVDSVFEVDIPEEAGDIRLQDAINSFEGEYISIINEIEKDRDRLELIPKKDSNLTKFELAKSGLLKDFDGKYRKKKEDFFEKVKSAVPDDELRNGVNSEYQSRFDKDFNRIKDEIKSKQFIVGEQPQGTENEDAYTPGLHISDSDQDSNNQGVSNGGQVNNQQELPPRDQRPQKPQSAQQSNQNVNNQNRQGRIVHPTQIPISDADPLYNQKVNKAQNEKVNAANGHTVYNKTLHIKDNPFQFYNDGSAMSTLLSISDMSKILEQDIETNICPNQMVTTFAVQNGQIYINGIAYLPTFEDNLLMSLPLSVRDKIAEGQLAEFFNLHTVRKYKNLEQLLILDGNLAQGRARKEMGIGFRKKWSVLFKKFKHLQFIQVGNIYYHRENPDSNVEEPILDRFKENPKLTFGSGNRRTLMDRVWDSTPVRIIARGIGWTGATAFVWAGATLFGPIGLLFGAFTMASAFKEIKNNKAANGQIKSGNTNNGSSKSTSSSKKGNSKKNNGFSKEYD